MFLCCALILLLTSPINSLSVPVFLRTESVDLAEPRNVQRPICIDNLPTCRRNRKFCSSGHEGTRHFMMENCQKTCRFCSSLNPSIGPDFQSI
ncbi:hypothetical protein QR680_013967 [Steinernema hermaphroditum]|uniref:ShKT domain-containing protein n=1 Tax=Steinernema hermaphroditum TaxID=289476 RepID=A0AA39IA12_9BILA|nr:hypothetical protein QR680_013967 [Steinernema hermaphroditum]